MFGSSTVHSLGFSHEENRPDGDRNQHVRIIEEKIKEHRKGDVMTTQKDTW